MNPSERLKNYLSYLILMCINCLQMWSYKVCNFLRGSKIVNFDNGQSVRVTKQIAEGGFSVVFEAFDNSPPSSLFTSSKKNGNHKRKSSTNIKHFALKRVLCGDSESRKNCEEEANVHKSLNHPNLLPILGFKFDKKSSSAFQKCYMLFPYLSTSLRDEITHRNLLESNLQSHRPFTEREILEIFSGCVDAVVVMHSKKLSHRDIKVENVMFDPSYYNNCPILIDYGSVGSLSTKVHTRSQVFSLVDSASTNSTISYRAPELFEGGITRYGKDEPNLDLGKADVWALGCLLFACMYGSSPFEIEFRADDAGVRIVECSHLRILGKMPRPILGSTLDRRYDGKLLEFVEYMLVPDRFKRPSIEEVVLRLDELLKSVGGTWVWRRYAGDQKKGEDLSNGNNANDDAFVQFV